MNQPKISVIIPAYNCAEYIANTIESLVCQNECTEAEILLINDGSTDNTEEVCARLAAEHEQIKVLTQENQGPSAARNLGLAHATGGFIVFVDADDVADQNMLSILSALMEDSVDLGMAAYSLDFIDGDKHEQECIQPENGIYPVDELFGKICCEWYARHILTTLCNKIYRREIIERYELRLDTEMSLSEDLLWNVRYLRHCSQVKAVDQNVYYYRIRRNRATVTHKFDPLHIHMQLVAAEEMIHFLEYIGYRGKEIYYLSLKYITSSLSNIYYTKRWNSESRHYFTELVMREPMVKLFVDNAEANGVFSRILIGIYRSRNVEGMKILLRMLYIFRRYFHPLQRKLMKLIKN